MHLGELIEELDSAIEHMEERHRLGRETVHAMPPLDDERAGLKRTLSQMRAHVYRLRLLREGLLAERQPGTLLN